MTRILRLLEQKQPTKSFLSGGIQSTRASETQSMNVLTNKHGDTNEDRNLFAMGMRRYTEKGERYATLEGAKKATTRAAHGTSNALRASKSTVSLRRPETAQKK